MIDFKKYTHAALFAGGLLFGTAGLKLLSSKDAKNVYAHTTAAALRVKDCDIRLNLPTEIRQAKAIVSDRADIVATAKDINEERAAKEDVIIEDAAEETSEAATEEETEA